MFDVDDAYVLRVEFMRLESGGDEDVLFGHLVTDYN